MANPNKYDHNAEMAHSRDVRRTVFSVWNRKGLIITQATARFDVNDISVARWIKNMERNPQGYPRRKIDLEAQDFLKHPDAYQHEWVQRFGVAQSAVFVALKKLVVTYKNRFTTLRRTKKNGAFSKIKLSNLMSQSSGTWRNISIPTDRIKSLHFW